VRTVSKNELKEHVLEYFQEIQSTGEPLIITDLGREAWEVRPLKKHRATSEVLAAYAAGVPSKLPAPDLLMEPLPIKDWCLE